MADMEALCRRVRELDQVVEELERSTVSRSRRSRAGRLPPLAPAVLDLAEIVGDGHLSGPSVVIVRFLSRATKNLLPEQEVVCEREEPLAVT